MDKAKKVKPTMEEIVGLEKGPPIEFSDNFLLLLEDLSDLFYDKKEEWVKKEPDPKTKKEFEDLDVITNFIFDLEKNPVIKNKIGVKTLEVSSSPDYFRLLIEKKDGNKEWVEKTVVIFIKYFINQYPDSGSGVPGVYETFSKLKENDNLGEMIQNFLKYYNTWIRNGGSFNKGTSTFNPSGKKSKNIYDYDDFDYDYMDTTRSSGSWTTKSYGGYKGGSYQDPFSSKGKYGTKFYGPSRGEPVNIPPFSYNPRDVRATFLSLTTETYPHGHEEEVMKYLPVPGLKKDQWGNYYLIIGNSNTMFTCHLDTASREKTRVNVQSYIENGDEIFVTDETSILGADDKAGVTIVLYMISHKIPGVYYFFIGEERGAIGSSKVSENFDRIPHLRDIKKCISFDRRNYFSVITSQLSQQCCSNQFAQSLCNELNSGGMQMRLDNTGVFTDSASFMSIIPECTNISVGYFSEHTRNESQNISFLDRLAKAVLGVKWENLVIARKVLIDPLIAARYSTLTNKMQRQRIYNKKMISTDDRYFYIDLPINETPILTVKRELETYKKLFDESNLQPTILFETGKIKFRLD